MSDVPPAVTGRKVRAGRRVLPALGLCAAGAALAAGLLAAPGAGCAADRRGLEARQNRVYPPAPQPPRVIALGTLRGAPPPAEAQVKLAEFLFGAPPPPVLTLVDPLGLAAGEDLVLICDPVLSAVFRWERNGDSVIQEDFTPPLEAPYACDLGPSGMRYVCDRQGVRRSDPGGRTLTTYALPAGQPYRPGDVLEMGPQVWVTNLLQHRIEVFDAESGVWQRSIGERGLGPGQLVLPRSLARTPEGQACVVDVMNARVQVFGPDGQWLGQIGGQGDVVGRFGRPKDVAVGPDGTVFVTDAFSQRVHAFSADGTPLLAFGEPGSGIGALTMPSGIAITKAVPRMGAALPPDAAPLYYIWVGEKLDEPGVRLYAWVRSEGEGVDAPHAAALREPPRPRGQWPALNPHWVPEQCGRCHQKSNGAWLPIQLPQTDALCLSCHDGVNAPAEPHPIGRPANTELVTTAADWPTVDGRIICLTCHDIMMGHCTPTTRRPVVNAALLRGWDPQQPLAYCSTCHRADVGGRFSPHRQRDATGRIREDACFFCHTQQPPVSEDGKRRFDPHLRVQTSDLCLNCHTKHWDLSPLGHVDRPVTPAIRMWMVMRDLSLTHADASPQELARLAEDPSLWPARLPLGQVSVGSPLTELAPVGAPLVTCYTCHNPHYTGLFPEGSELGALAKNPDDRRGALRTDWIELCSECHRR